MMKCAIVMGPFDQLKPLAPGRPSVPDHICSSTIRWCRSHHRAGLTGKYPNRSQMILICLIMKCAIYINLFDPLKWLTPGQLSVSEDIYRVTVR